MFVMFANMLEYVLALTKPKLYFTTIVGFLPAMYLSLVSSTTAIALRLLRLSCYIFTDISSKNIVFYYGCYIFHYRHWVFHFRFDIFDITTITQSLGCATILRFMGLISRLDVSGGIR